MEDRGYSTSRFFFPRESNQRERDRARARERARERDRWIERERERERERDYMLLQKDVNFEAPSLPLSLADHSETKIRQREAGNKPSSPSYGSRGAAKITCPRQKMYYSPAIIPCSFGPCKYF